MALAVPEVVAGQARLAVLAQLAVLARLAVEARLAVVVELAVEEVPLYRSFSAAMVGNLPSAGTPPYAAVPKSGRKAKRRP